MFQTTTAPFSLVFNCWKPLAAFNGCKLISRKRTGAFLEAAQLAAVLGLSRSCAGCQLARAGAGGKYPS